MAKSITYVGLDVHKDTIAVALAEAGFRGEVRQHGTILNTPAALKTLAVKLARTGRDLRFCYEAGPCGYGTRSTTPAITSWTGDSPACLMDRSYQPRRPCPSGLADSVAELAVPR
jgi:hypothetical protein